MACLRFRERARPEPTSIPLPALTFPAGAGHSPAMNNDDSQRRYIARVLARQQSPREAVEELIAAFC